MTASGATDAPKPVAAESRPFHYVDFFRYFAIALLVVGALLAAVSVNAPWWTIERISLSNSGNDQVQNVVVIFNAGDGLSCSSWKDWHPNPCLNVTGRVGGSVGRLDNVVNYVISAIGVGAAASVALLGAGFAGRCFGRRQLHLAIALAFAVGILALGLLGAGIALGPGPQAASYCSALSGNTTSCASFLGSVQAGIIPGACTECSTRFTWGGGYGWYATLGGAAASLFAGYLLWRGRAGPFTPAEQAEWAARNRPYSLTGRTLSHAKGIRGTPPPPTGRSAIPFASGRTSRWVCRHCGTVNSPWATHCGGCRESRSHPGR